ncbi:uncharacterized protein LOC116129586 [Pistacia vera]|uniref:uncharacterized protein LOC116129586 n=1 Tax=Pistacia vera TaxID=55513 RepID=UPI001262F6C7|nr:uncharacterized protein LOC116129586 [Pistacia vera]
MDSRLDNVEKEVTKLGVEMGTIRECLVELQSWVRRKNEEESSRTEGRSTKNIQSHNDENINGASGSGSSNQNRSEIGGRKLEMPIFSDEDPYGWIFRVERYFNINGISEEGKLTAATVCMEGEAINWFQWTESKTPASSWAMLKLALLQRFNGSQELNPYESLMAMKQTGSVVDFRRQFEAVAALLVGEKEEILQAAFINGLKTEIRAEVRLAQPNSLIQIIELAQRIEEKNQALEEAQVGVNRVSRTSGPGFSYGSRSITHFDNHNPTQFNISPKFPNSTVSTESLKANPNTFSHVTQRPLESSMQGSTANSYPREPTTTSSRPFERHGFPRRDLPFLRMTDAEIQMKREKEICFKCDGKYSIGHKCGEKQFQILLIDEKEEEDPDPSVGEEIIETETEKPQENVELSLSSVVGIQGPKTMKLKGRIQGKEWIVLIDSGASHNFISSKVVEQLGIPVVRTQSFGVGVGDRYSVRCEGECRDVCMELQGVNIIQNFFPFDMSSADVVLGIAWLETLGETITYCRKQIMKFTMGHKTVYQSRDPSLTKTLVSLKAMIKTLQSEGQGCLIEFGQLQTQSANAGSIDDRLLQVLGKFSQVFEPLSGLPPVRSRDHAIQLIPGTQPPNLRTYRYPYYQKNEIERFVKEMLASGIIKPSISPFFSPVLLVKKKDGGWQFCVDYRAVNKVTIPDKFPIPAIDELFDELEGATVFSKLDLKSDYHQIRVRPKNKPKTAFPTHEGHYEFLVMPFGLTNAPATFQAIMNDENQLVVNQKKCQFRQLQLEYLGHIVSAEGVAVDPSKIDSITKRPTPKDIRELRGFLGLIGYYRRFVRDYGKVALPLTALLKKDSFGWNPTAPQAFEDLKRIMTSVPVLRMPNFTQEFIIETDASRSGSGAVLMQEGRPIAFLS